MKKYLSFFRIRFSNGIQYRAAAFAGVLTQFAWGFMSLLMYWAFYKTGKSSFPMTFEQLSSYIWLQQAFMTLFMAWFFENDIFNAITSGNVAYELCRPIDIYSMWFIRNVANRLSKVVLRALPILIVSIFLPIPFNISPPINWVAGVMFVVSLTLGFMIMVAFNMFIYISTFYMLSPMGIKIMSVSLVELFSGAVVPLPFLPESIRFVFELIPFASMMNTPFMIYSGKYDFFYGLLWMLLQLFWITVLVFIGKILINNALKKVVVQGG